MDAKQLFSNKESFSESRNNITCFEQCDQSSAASAALSAFSCFRRDCEKMRSSGVLYYLVFDIVRTGADALNRLSVQQQRLLNWVDAVDFHTCFSQCRKSVKIVNRGQCWSQRPINLNLFLLFALITQNFKTAFEIIVSNWPHFTAIEKISRKREILFVFWNS